MSSWLQQKTFFGSFNTAFDPFIRNVSGAVSDTLNYGDLFSYDRSPRQLIFARNQSNINTLDDMKRMMRYNDFEVRWNCIRLIS